MQLDNPSLSAALTLLKAGRATRTIAGGTTNFLLESANSAVHLLASNLVSETSCVVTATKVEDGSFTIPPEFADIVERCPDAPVDLKATEKRAAVSIGTSKFRFPILPGDAFPKLAVGDFQQRFKLPSASLKKVLSDTIAFAPHNDPRFYLNGVHLSFSRESVIAVATNGHVMSVSVSGVDIDAAGNFSRIIPTQAARQLLRILDCNPDAEVGVAEKILEIKCGQAQLRIKPIEGTFPDWRSILKNKPSHTVSMKKRSVLDALGRVNLFADRRQPVAAFDVRPDGINIATSNHDDGSSSERVAFDDGVTGVKKQFHARIDYVEVAVDTIQTESIRLSYWENALTSFWFRKIDTDDCVIVVTPCKE